VFEHGYIDLISDETRPLIAVRTHTLFALLCNFGRSRLRIARIGAEVVNWMKKEAEDAKCSEVVIRPGGKHKVAEKTGFREFMGSIWEFKICAVLKKQKAAYANEAKYPVCSQYCAEFCGHRYGHAYEH